MINSFPHEYQMDRMDCGPASIKIIAKYFGKYYSLQYLRDLCGMTREGVSFYDLTYTCEKIGLRTLASEASMDDMRDIITLPCIIHWNESHFVVVYKSMCKFPTLRWVWRNTISAHSKKVGARATTTKARFWRWVRK